jgi:hypothetical protein
VLATSNTQGQIFARKRILLQTFLAAHVEHSPPRGPVYPALQQHATADALPICDQLLAGQAANEETPASLLYLPAAHATQLAAGPSVPGLQRPVDGGAAGSLVDERRYRRGGGAGGGEGWAGGGGGGGGRGGGVRDCTDGCCLPESSFKPCRFLYATSTGSPAAGGFVAARVWVLTRVVVWPSCVPSPPCKSGSWLACSSFIPWCHCAVTRECEAVLASPHCRREKATAQAPAPARMHSPARIEQNGASEGGRHGRHVGQKLPSAVRQAQRQRRPPSKFKSPACLFEPPAAASDRIAKRRGTIQSHSQPPHWARHAGEFSTAKEAGLSMQNPCRLAYPLRWMPSDV